jgi:hypothetical protein
LVKTLFSNQLPVLTISQDAKICKINTIATLKWLDKSGKLNNIGFQASFVLRLLFANQNESLE